MLLYTYLSTRYLALTGTILPCSSLAPPIDLVSNPHWLRIVTYWFRIVSASGSENDRTTKKGATKDERRMIREWYGIDTWQQSLAAIFLHRWWGCNTCFIVLIFESFYLVWTCVKIRHGSAKSKSIHNRLQSVYYHFIMARIHSQSIYRHSRPFARRLYSIGVSFCKDSLIEVSPAKGKEFLNMIQVWTQRACRSNNFAVKTLCM